MCLGLVFPAGEYLTFASDRVTIAPSIALFSLRGGLDEWMNGVEGDGTSRECKQLSVML